MPRKPSNSWHESFLTELANSRNVSKAAASVGIKRDTAYRHYRDDAEFAARWDEARNWQAGFLEALSRSGNVTMAARSAGISRRAASRARRQDPEFAKQWEAALWEGVETLEGIALERAIEGKSDGMLKFLITNARKRLGPDPLATPAGAPCLAAPPLAEPLTYTDENGMVRPVSEWEGARE